jgi:hypothetical protein
MRQAFRNYFKRKRYEIIATFLVVFFLYWIAATIVSFISYLLWSFILYSLIVYIIRTFK